MKQLIERSIHYFPNPLYSWSDIKLVTNGKSGVYALINSLTWDLYIGSSTNLLPRVRTYFRDSGGHNDKINADIKKYGIEVFALAILEYTEETFAKENAWIEEFDPSYNKVKVAGVAGDAISPRGQKRSEEVRKEMSLRQMGKNNTFYGKKHSDTSKQLIREAALARTKSHKPASSVNVLDTLTGVPMLFSSIREATRHFKCSIATINKHDGVLYKDRYLITINKSNRSG